MGILVSLVIKKEISIRQGVRIVVRTVPVDPRSLFTGDYIDLNYEFSRIDLDEVVHDEHYFRKGKKVFVKLLKKDDSWNAIQVSVKPINDIAQNEIMIAGYISYCSQRNFINITYGIESYFVPEGKGKIIERGILDKRVKVELSVDKKGNASVCKIFIDEKEIKFK